MSFLGIGAALSNIGEVVVSKFFDFLLDKLFSSEFLQFPSEDQIQKELDKLKKELLEIRKLLDDAEERQLKDSSVKSWLSDLQNLAYDVDDIVDELETEASRRQLMERRGSSSKRRKLITDPLADRVMMTKIKDITAKLKDLEPRRNQLQLRMIDYPKPTRTKERQQPTSLEIDTHVYGRDKDKKTILELVFKSDDEGGFVIPIVGMGGIGKTTLAQLVYNDADVQNHFALKAWVTVSDDFDVTRITKAILQSITSRPCHDDDDLNSLQAKLKKELSEKKFLIVLDDVWNENYQNWTVLQSPFLARTPGSKIIVTTRSSVVSSTMGASRPHALKGLSENDCLFVFAQHALGATDFGGHPNLKEVGEKIVRKCSGLPLAAKTLGGLLRTNVDHDAWKDMLESEIWKLSEDQCAIIPALQLSYHHLPPHLKRCFAYCSILPKDYEFEEKEIVLLWRAEGFLQGARDKHSIEDLGHRYFRDLVSRSLFQRSSEDRSRFIMHDLINDLAQSVAGDICFRIEGDRKISKNARHLSYIRNTYNGIKKFDGVSEALHLRTFLPLSQRNNSWYYKTYEYSQRLRNYATVDVVMQLMPKLSFLRVLSLGGYRITKLPDSIGDMKHLRYLNFSHTLIKCLPESVSALYNLETLLLRECSKLEKLPSEMENLVNLCYLDITGANCLKGLENVLETQDAWKAKLYDKARLEKLELKWSENFENRKGEMEERVLDLLQPSEKLKELAIESYCGMTLARWVGDSSFNELQSLRLENCPNCTSLPPVGHLSLLKDLRIKGFHNVTSVGTEFFGEKTPNAFPSLEILLFEDMPRWENWNFCDVDEEARKFPRLRELHIVNCPILLGSIPECLPSYEKLVIRGCEKLAISIQVLPTLSEIKIQGCHRVVYKGFADELDIICCSSVTSFPEEGIPTNLRHLAIGGPNICKPLIKWGLHRLTSLKSLRISNGCPEAVLFPLEEIGMMLPSSLTELSISNFPKLEILSSKGFQDLTSLEKLYLFDCPNLKSLPAKDMLSSLLKLQIRNCPVLKEGCEKEKGAEWSKIAHIRYLVTSG
ncbi:hypothetical protein PTKIN_Ptkin16aG0003200 [Pterospermum kingtungense]